MRFGEIAADEAQGAVLGHSVKHAGGVFKKGRVLSAEDIDALKQSGIPMVFAAILAPDDISEDVAARTIATAIGGEGARVQEPFTGRANLHAIHHGLVVVDSNRVRALNRVHESLTL